jgi:polyisoprenoid-binding protein YceI
MAPPDEVVSDLSTYTGTWTLDPARTTIEFHTKAVWVLPVTGTARALEGSGTVAPDGTLTGSLVVDAASIDTKNTKRDAHLRTADFFDVANHPALTFAVTSGRVTAPGEVELRGDLIIHGQSRPFTVPGRLASTGTDATVTTEVHIDRSEFGLHWTKLGAGLHNRVVVSAHFDKA